MVNGSGWGWGLVPKVDSRGQRNGDVVTLRVSDVAQIYRTPRKGNWGPCPEPEAWKSSPF